MPMTDLSTARMPGLSAKSITAALMMAAFHIGTIRAASIENFRADRSCNGGSSYTCLNLQPRQCCFRADVEIQSSQFTALPFESWGMIHQARSVANLPPGAPALPTPCHGEILDTQNGVTFCMWRPTAFHLRPPTANYPGSSNTVYDYDAASYEQHSNVMIEEPKGVTLPAKLQIAGAEPIGTSPNNVVSPAHRRRAMRIDRRRLSSPEHKDTSPNPGYLKRREVIFNTRHGEWWVGYKVVDNGTIKIFDPNIEMCPAPFQAFKKPCDVRKPDIITFADGHKFRITEAPEEDVKALFDLWKKGAKYDAIPQKLKKYEMDKDNAKFRLQDWKRKSVDENPKGMAEKKEEHAAKVWNVRDGIVKEKSDKKN